MLNNSCIDIPSLFLILGLASAYPYRKYYTKTVLEYTFFVIYYVQFVTILKFIQEIIVKIEFIQDLIKENPDHPIVAANNLVFGNVDSRPKAKLSGEAGMSPELLAAAFLAQLFACFWVLQNWKICKWIQIRA